MLLITHPGGGKTFGYRDYWDGHDLIYAGRRKIGDQQATAENLDVMEDRSGRSSFRGGRPRPLLFLGHAQREETRAKVSSFRTTNHPQMRPLAESKSHHRLPVPIRCDTGATLRPCRRSTADTRSRRHRPSRRRWMSCAASSAMGASSSVSS